MAVGRVNVGQLNANVPLSSTVSSSPRGGNPNRDGNNGGGRKYRGTSRQSNQAGGYRGSNGRRQQNRYGDGYNGNNDVRTQQGSEIQMLPQIVGPSTNSVINYNNSGGNTLGGSKRSGYQSNSPSGPSPAASFTNGGGAVKEGVISSGSNVTAINNFTTTEEHNISAVYSVRGLKPGNPNWINQDNFFVIENFDGRDVKLFCVLDGHGEHGHHVSRRCRESFPQFIRSSNLDMDHAFNMMQNDLNASDIDVKCSGATCVLACIVGGKLSVYNCGDSRAVLGRRNPNGSVTAHALSSDHKPDKPEERKRILSCGGHLGCRQVLVNQNGRGPVSMPVGPCRVWYQHRGETLGLAMSRSLGDAIVHKCGVSAEPEILEHALDDADEFIILATDGVWDVVDNNHAVQMVHNFASRSINWSALEAANCVCKFARGRWEKLSPMIDDITCIVVKLSSKR
jgi:serine/threonine protein phosphatase PrpC